MSFRIIPFIKISKKLRERRIYIEAELEKSDITIGCYTNPERLKYF